MLHIFQQLKKQPECPWQQEYNMPKNYLLNKCLLISSLALICILASTPDMMVIEYILSLSIWVHYVRNRHLIAIEYTLTWKFSSNTVSPAWHKNILSWLEKGQIYGRLVYKCTFILSVHWQLNWMKVLDLIYGDQIEVLQVEGSLPDKLQRIVASNCGFGWYEYMQAGCSWSVLFH